MYTTKSNTALLLLLLFSAVAFSWNKDTACTDTIKNNTAPADTNLKGFVVFNKANFSVKKETFIVKGMQIVAVLEPKPENTDATPLQNTKSICHKTIKASNAYAKYVQTKAKTPTAAKHQTLLTSLQPEHTTYTVLFDSNTDKISLNFKTNSPKITVPQKIKSQTLALLFANNEGKTIPKNFTKIFKLFVKPTFYYGSSAFANRPPPGTPC